MKVRLSFTQILAFAVGTALSFAGLSCKQGPVNYDVFEERTVEANLAAVDSASSIYATLLAAGDIDAGAQQALAFLLTQPGVDSGVITSDSTVWAFFSSGLLAGTGDIQRDTTGSGAAGPEREPTVHVSYGGETGDYTHYVLPHHAELPGTQKAANAMRDIFKRKLNWDNDEMYKGSEVDLGMALGLVKMGGGILFWSGHGVALPLDVSGLWGSGLVLGKGYSTKALAEAAVSQLTGYLNPGPGQERQAAVLNIVGSKVYSIIVLPGFVRANGDFNGSESLPINQTKAIVYLSCCYSAYSQTLAVDPPLVRAFLDAGADFVTGWSWEVGDDWSCGKDTTFFRAMADSCFGQQAMAEMGNLIDPVERRGSRAEFCAFGDSMVLLRAVCQVKRDDELLRPGYVQATRSISGSGIGAVLYPEQSTDPAANVMISFPGDQPGLFNCTSDENATIYWTDAGTGYTYTVMKNYVGVNGMISVDRCRSDAITGHFYGKLGWWDFGKDPEKEPPSDTITLDAGVFKFTGKVTAGDFVPSRPGLAARD